MLFSEQRLVRKDDTVVQVRLAPASDDAKPLDLVGEPGEVRRAAGRLARDLPPGRNLLDARGWGGDALRALVEGLVLGCYRFTRASAPEPGVDDIVLCGASDEDALRDALRAAAATAWARDLANTRAAEKTPGWLAAQAAKVLTRHGVDVTVRDDAWLRDNAFGGVLAVGGGSANPPRLIEAAWKPRGARRDVHVVLVGKGITFDTGGLNRKTGSAMNTMYTDMAGGAAVLAALRLVAEARLPVRVTALVPTAENAISGSAYRPSDVVRHYGGRTSEIANTDAEGRLVLADALAYAAARLRPTVLVDIATLTGAMKVALGLDTGGLIATSDALGAALVAAGSVTGEPLWRLPLPVEYESLLDSSVADATNAPGNPGGITAALFLRPFTAGLPWAHLDVAGPARAGKDDGMFTQGATGFGTRLLANWIASLA
jgi:leucyl aminopeptidase